MNAWKPYACTEKEINCLRLLKPGERVLLAIGAIAEQGDVLYITEPFSYSDTAGRVDYAFGGSIDASGFTKERHGLFQEWLDANYWNGPVDEYETVEREKMPPCISRFVVRIERGKFINQNGVVDSVNIIMLENWAKYPPKQEVEYGNLRVHSVIYRPLGREG